MNNDLSKKRDGSLFSKQELKDLEKSIALLKEKNKLYEQQLALGKKLNEEDAKKFKFNQGLIKQNEQIIEQYKQESRVRKEGFKELTDKGGAFNERARQGTVKGLVSNANSNRNSTQFKSISDWYNSSQLQKQEVEANKIYDKVLKSTYNKYFKAGKDLSDKDVQASLRAEVEMQASKEIGKAAGKYGKASAILDGASKLFSKAVNTWVGVATAGLKNQTSVYENTFTNVSVRTNTSRGRYQDMQALTNNELSTLGLRNNVATSDVQQMWNSLASIGANQETMFERAIDNVVTNKIVPYLDTTSVSVNLLNNRLDGKFVKDIRGINQANLDIAGNNYATQELLNTIIDQVQPMSDKALEDLAQGSTEVTALIGQLIASGMDPNVAKAYGTKYFKMQKYSDQIMRSGTVAEKMTMSNVLGSGLNPYDLKDANNIMGLAVDTEMMLAGNAPGYTNAMTGLSTNIIGSALGLDYDTMSSLLNLRDKGLSGKQFADKSDLTSDKLQEYIDIANKAFSGDKNQTQKTLQNITLENLMNELSVWYERFGNWAELIIDAIKGVGAYLVTSAIGKGISALAGTGGGGAGPGLLGALGVGGTAVATIGLTTAAIYGIGKATRGEFDNMTNRTQEEIKNDLANSENTEDNKWANNNAVTKAIASTDTSQQQGGIKEAFSNFYGGMRTWGANWFNSDYIERNKEFWGWLNSSGTFSEDTSAGTIQRIAAYYLWDKAGSLASIDGITRDDLVQIAEEAWNLKAIQQAAHALVNAGWAPSNKEKEKVTAEIDFASYGAPKGSYRTGLSEVPYDDYPALLHEGEAVLTASTANELRNLLTEYRDTTTQAINFDTIVQTQTETLVMKIDEIITAIKSTGGSVTSTSHNRLNEKLTNSMTYMRSTKSF